MSVHQCRALVMHLRSALQRLRHRTSQSQVTAVPLCEGSQPRRQAAMTMIGMPVGKKTPKSELHEFYQLHPGNPTFVIKGLSSPPAEPLFLCTLTCPAIGGPQGLAEQSFTGQGRNKKTAEQYAAEKALQSLRNKGLLVPALIEMNPQQLPPDLQRQFTGATSDTVSFPTHYDLVARFCSTRLVRCVNA